MHLKSRPQHKYSELPEKGSIYRQPQVKTVSIFINNLDRHIAQSYQKLKKNKSKELSSRKQDDSISQKHPLEQTLYKDQSTMLDYTSKFMTNSLKKDYQEIESMVQSSKYQENIVLIENEEVNEYISYVYDMYNIPDPLQSSDQDRSRINRTSKRTFTGTPSMRKKSSASEFKDKIVLQRDIDLEPFNVYSNRKDDHRFDFSLRASRTKQKAKELSSTGVKSKNIDSIPQTIRLTARKHTKTPSCASDTLTPQVFRYCFACEEAVLEANLKHHEKSCRSLQIIFNNSLEELVELLDQKIARISKQIQTEFVEASNQKWLSQFRDLKRSVGQWISDVREIGNKDNQVISSARKKMTEIQSNWGSTLSNRFDQIAKLHWFGRLRQNIRKTYNI